ncbi:MAG: hypothetical protein HQL13_03590 [Candidatus Omnitrophica bacterium]|nr:hypothetical protein [Candidatus Omnitrophota bacterium]
MRTTIDMPIYIRQKLSQEASNRNLKGFSRIITEALEKYFDSKSNDRKSIVKNLKGSMSKTEYAKALKDIQEGRLKWRMS